MNYVKTVWANGATEVSAENLNKMENRIKNLDAISNPNLLINGDFQVWQRGTNFTATKSGQYTADRWLFTTTNHTVSRMNAYTGGIMIVNPAAAVIYLRQRMPISEYAKVAGKQLAISADIETDGTLRFEVYDRIAGKNVWQGSTQAGVDGKYTDSVTIPANTSSAYLEVSVIFSGATYAKVKSVKLEVGDIATPLVSRPYTQELTDCCYYYQPFAIPQVAIPCDGGSDIRILVIPKMGSYMRVKPTFILTVGLFAHECSAAATTYALASAEATGGVTQDSTTNYYIHRSALTTASELTTGNLYSINGSSGTNNRISGDAYGFLDAEL